MSSSKSDRPEPKSEPESSSSEPFITSRNDVFRGGAEGDDTGASSCDVARPRDTRLRILVQIIVMGNTILLCWWVFNWAGRRTPGVYQRDTA